MKLIAIIALVVVWLVGCGGVRQVNTNFVLPEIHPQGFLDTPFQQGWEYLKQGDADQALRSFELSHVQPEQKLVGIGYARLAQNRFNEARDCFYKVQRLNAQNMDAAIGIATSYEAQGDQEKAFPLYTKLLAQYPENSWIRSRYDYIKVTATQRLLQEAENHRLQSRPDEFVRALEKALQYSPEMVSIWSQIADFHYGNGAWNESLPYYEAVLEKQPFNQEVMFRLVDLYEKSGKFDMALVDVQKLLELRPGDAALESKKSELTRKLQETTLPQKFKNIFFKTEINREELAALIGYYFDRQLRLEGEPVIITDIESSFAKTEIIILCTIGIMPSRPDHTFDRYAIPNRSTLAVILNTLIVYLERKGVALQLPSAARPVEPADVSPLHKNYSTIRFIVNADILGLDNENNFNPTATISPFDAISALRKIAGAIKK